MMRDEDDERLAAWLDGAMTPEEAAEFEAELAANQELAARAELWRGNDEFVADALVPIADAPVEPDLLARMGLAGPNAANDNPPWWRRNAGLLGGAMAASLALVVLLAQPPEQAQDGLSLALERTPSSQQVRLADGRVIEPRLTVQAADGRWCREYRSDATLALACRQDGRWTVEVEVEAGKAGTAGGGDFGLAAGPDAAALDAAYKRIGASDPLDAGREAALIGRAWGQP